jgi:alpha-L-glutamate ligase-like protein
VTVLDLCRVPPEVEPWVEPRGVRRRWWAAAWRGYDDVLGLNSRNQHIVRANSPAAIRLVTDKAATKEVLLNHGVPVTGTLAVIESRRWARRLSMADMPDAWVMKPNRGRGGNGILIAHGRAPAGPEQGWRRTSGRPLPVAEVRDHLRLVLDGEFSGRARDEALLEPVVRPHEGLAHLTYQGLPDIRVMCAYDQPRLAMLRLPTAHSGGRANLHQGAVGAAVDIDTGRILGARAGRRELLRHPDTDQPLIGARVPYWDQVLHAAARCGPATGLTYLGADVVVTDAGPLVLEVNARPGLQIQNVTAGGMREVLEVPTW